MLTYQISAKKGFLPPKGKPYKELRIGRFSVLSWCFVNDPELMHFSYLRFLENRLRESFGFEGTPLKLIVRGRKEEEDY